MNALNTNLITEGNAALAVVNEEEINNDVVSLRDAVAAMTITDQTSFETSAIVLKDITQHKKRIIDYFKPLVQKAHEAHKAIKAKENEAVKPYEEFEAAIRRKQSAFLTEQERIRKAEEAKQRAAAEEAARKEKERLEKEAEKLLDKGKVEKAEAKIEQAEAVFAAPVTVEPVIEKTVAFNGGSITGKKDLDITLPTEAADIRTLCAAVASGLLPVSVVKFSLSDLKAWGKLNKITGKHHGVVFTEKIITSVR